MGNKKLNQRFITFEGIEGSGKSTHSKLISDYLKENGYPVVYTREPGGTKIGEEIRKVLLNPEYQEMSSECELFLYMASRSQLISEVIKPNLNSGRIVICDRFFDATICYQGYGDGINLSAINQMVDIALKNILPGLTIFLDVEVKQTIESIEDPDRMEKKSLNYHRRVREGYLELAKTYPDRIKTVKLKDDIESTKEEIIEIVTSYLGIS